jgi:hypothetical protein
MGERPRPDIDHTRDALREHDERVSDDAAEPAAPPDDAEAETEESRSDDDADEDG